MCVADLCDAFEIHREEAQGRVERLEEVFESMDEDFEETTMAACLIAAVQRAERCGTPAYGLVALRKGSEKSARQ